LTSAFIIGIGREDVVMNVLVRRDQFNITPQGVVHKPTDAAFTPYPDDPYSGITRLGQVRSQPPNGNGFRPEDVQRIMPHLWVEYVISNAQLFKTAEPGDADPRGVGFNWPGLVKTD
jgi:hypothetical protein